MMQRTSDVAYVDAEAKYLAYIDQICATVVEEDSELDSYCFQETTTDLWFEIQAGDEFTEQPSSLYGICNEYLHQKFFSSELLYHSFLDIFLNAPQCGLCWLIFKSSNIPRFSSHGTFIYYPFSMRAIEAFKSPKRITIQFGCDEGFETQWIFDNDNIIESSLGIACNEAFNRKEFLMKELSTTFPEFRDIPEDPMSNDCMTTVKSWITNCKATHDECKSATDHNLPTRVLDISSRDEPFLTEESTANDPYVALSYCWGSCPKDLPPKTTCRNLETRKNQLPMADLPILFRDAIYITRYLGIKYIWIDSLCIVQNSDDHDCQLHNSEWEKEGVKMAQYYGNAYLTISSLSSGNCQEGMFKKRKRFFKLGINGLKIMSPVLSWSEIFLNSVLQTRAWVLQERLLSKRILHYSDHEMLWECHKLSRREALAEHVSMLNTSSRNLESFGLKQILSLEKYGGQINNQRGFKVMSLEPIWAVIVSNYNRRRLSNRTDRLVAISGIAAFFKSRIRGDTITYMAGHRYANSHGNSGKRMFNLLWEETPLESTQDTPPDNSYVAPSWSWASIDVSFLPSQDSRSDLTFDEDVEICDFLISHKENGWISGFDVMGYIPLGSRLFIKAFTKEVIVREHEGTREGYSVCYLDSTPFGDARLPRKYSSMISQQASKQLGPSTAETVRCKAVRIMQSPFFEVGKERRSTSFLLIARQADLYPSGETSLDDSSNRQITKTGIPHDSANPTTDERTTELWVRIGSGTTVDSPYKTGDFLGVFSGSGKEEIVLT